MLNFAPLLLSLQLTQAPGDTLPQDPQQLNLDRRITPEVIAAHQARPAVVYIETDVVTAGYDVFGWPVAVPGKSGGSGVVIYDEGFVVTNFHVVKEAQKITIRFDSELDPNIYPARLISAKPEQDLALLKIDSERPFPTVQLGTSSDLMIAEPVLAIGNPLGQTLTVSRGIVSGLHRNVPVGGIEFENLIQTDASINPGNSGGPLLNINGELIGINTAMNAAAENIGFAIPVDRVREVLDQYLLSPKYANAWFGFALADGAQSALQNAQQNGSPANLGSADPLKVTQVMAGSPAGRAGIEVGDRLVGIGDRIFANLDEYNRARVLLSPGEQARFKLQRGGKTLELNATGWSRIDALLFERAGLRVEPYILANGRNQMNLLNVLDVRSKGPADELGIKPGDLIEAMRAERRRTFKANNAEDLAFYVSQLPARTRLELDVWRSKSSADNKQRFLANDAELLRGTLELE